MEHAPKRRGCRMLWRAALAASRASCGRSYHPNCYAFASSSVERGGLWFARCSSGYSGLVVLTIVET